MLYNEQDRLSQRCILKKFLLMYNNKINKEAEQGDAEQGKQQGSRAEQSRAINKEAEQSRAINKEAEQSKRKQSRAVNKKAEQNRTDHYMPLHI
jgi:hypothetical protein